MSDKTKTTTKKAPAKKKARAKISPALVKKMESLNKAAQEFAENGDMTKAVKNMLCVQLDIIKELKR